MISSVALISVLTSVAWAQTSIPTGISSQCTQFLTSLNNDQALAACTSPLVSATSAYGPTTQHNNPTVAGVTSALAPLCADSVASSCPASLIRGKLSEFYANCAPELTTQRSNDVVRNYDVLYAMLPLRQAVCSKDDKGAYCITQTTPPPKAASAPGHTKRAPAADSQVAFFPNTTSMAATNILFLYLTPNLPADKLCTSCTRNVLRSYMDFEASVPYAPGLAQSALFPGQLQLYQGVTKTCGKDFLGGPAQAAGGIGSNGPFGAKKQSGGARVASTLGFAGIGVVFAAIASAVGL